jgi:hypothetical protein
MALGGRDFNSRNDQKVVHGQTIWAHQSAVSQVLDCVTRVVVGNGKSAQAFSASGFDELLRATDAVPGKKRVAMQVDLQRHAAIN